MTATMPRTFIHGVRIRGNHSHHEHRLYGICRKDFDLRLDGYNHDHRFDHIDFRDLTHVWNNCLKGFLCMVN
jgi:hypothetical protein